MQIRGYLAMNAVFHCIIQSLTFDVLLPFQEMILPRQVNDSTCPNLSPFRMSLAGVFTQLHTSTFISFLLVFNLLSWNTFSIWFCEFCMSSSLHDTVAISTAKRTKLISSPFNSISLILYFYFCFFHSHIEDGRR
jgi:hypothetical protein